MANIDRIFAIFRQRILCVCVSSSFTTIRPWALISLGVNWMQLPPSPVTLSVISQLAIQPFFRPSSDTQSLYFAVSVVLSVTLYRAT